MARGKGACQVPYPWWRSPFDKRLSQRVRVSGSEEMQGRTRGAAGDGDGSGEVIWGLFAGDPVKRPVTIPADGQLVYPGWYDP